MTGEHRDGDRTGAPDAVAAELEIRNLVARLAHLADGGTVEEYLDCFADGARWEMPANRATGVAAGARVGRDEIEAGVRERRAAGVQGPGTSTRHVITTVRIEVEEPERARGEVYWLFYGETATAPVLRTMGAYRDTYRRTPAGWKLSSRAIVIG